MSTTFCCKFHFFCIMRMEMVNMSKRQQPHRDEKCQFKLSNEMLFLGLEREKKINFNFIFADK